MICEPTEVSLGDNTRIIYTVPTKVSFQVTVHARNGADIGKETLEGMRDQISIALSPYFHDASMRIDDIMVATDYPTYGSEDDS